MDQTVTKKQGMYINGEWRRPENREYFKVTNPFSGELLGTLPEASEEDVREAAHFAQQAVEEELLTPEDRYRVLSTTAELIERDTDVFVETLVREVGKTRKEAASEVRGAISAFTAAAEEAKRIKGEEIPTPGASPDQKFAVMLKVPSGPVCAIIAFNAPLNQGSHKVASALAAGCSVVLKPPPLVPFHAIHLVKLVEEAGLPKGLLHLLFGGSAVGNALLEAEEFARYMFTGSLKVGQLIANKAGLRPVILEMGSNAPNIVHHDADIDKAVSACLAGYAVAGQVCTSVQRLFVHQDIFDEFAEKFTTEVSALRVGDPMDKSTHLGPVRTDEAAARFDSFIEEATEKGAKVLVGGERQGRMIQPTILTDVSPDLSVYHQEAFLPIVDLMAYEDFDRVLEEANNSEYGLQAGIFTRNLNLAFKAARKLRVGGVMINDVSRFRTAWMPFGGVKGSGVGREGIPYAIEALMDIRNLVLNLSEE